MIINRHLKVLMFMSMVVGSVNAAGPIKRAARQLPDGAAEMIGPEVLVELARLEKMIADEQARPSGEAIDLWFPYYSCDRLEMLRCELYQEALSYKRAYLTTKYALGVNWNTALGDEDFQECLNEKFRLREEVSFDYLLNAAFKTAFLLACNICSRIAKKQGARTADVIISSGQSRILLSYIMDLMEALLSHPASAMPKNVCAHMREVLLPLIDQ